MRFNIARNRDMERHESFRESAIEWAEDGEFDYEDEDELIAAYADYMDWQYEQYVDRQIDELRDRCLG